MIRPILFNTEMATAILEDRKTVTRRLLKLPRHIKKQEDGLYTLFTEGTCYENQHLKEIVNYIKPPYQVGDILYVRETWKCWRAHRYEATADIMFKAGGKDTRIFFANGNTDSADRYDYDQFVCKWHSQKWHPSIHMPKEAARIWLKVTDARPERLQDITHVDIIMEGIKPEYIDANSGEKTRNDFSQLWNSTIKKSDINLYGWNANPWVWVIEFERCEEPEEWRNNQC